MVSDYVRAVHLVWFSLHLYHCDNSAIKTLPRDSDKGVVQIISQKDCIDIIFMIIMVMILITFIIILSQYFRISLFS